MLFSASNDIIFISWIGCQVFNNTEPNRKRIIAPAHTNSSGLRIVRPCKTSNWEMSGLENQPTENCPAVQTSLTEKCPDWELSGPLKKHTSLIFRAFASLAHIFSYLLLWIDCWEHILYTFKLTSTRYARREEGFTLIHYVVYVFYTDIIYAKRYDKCVVLQ